MRIFELHFNPRAKNETAEQIFDSFCYEPENIYERRVGSLYMVGELRNLLPQNLRLLNNLSQVIKGKFYASPLQVPEKAFEEGLKKANEFLAEEVSKENVSWLGNLNFAVLALKTQTQNIFLLNFTKVGNIKILLLRGGQIIDIGKNLDFEEIEPYPLKIFTNAVSGKLFFGDKIMILTQEVYDFFSNPPKFSEEKFGRAKQNLLNEFIKIESFEEKKIREILKPKEKELSEISGIFLFIDTEKEPLEKPRIVTFQKELEKLSIKEVFSPLIKISVKFILFFQNTFNKIISKLSNVFRFPKLKIKLKIPRKLSFAFLKIKPKIKITNSLKRNLILVLLLVFILVVGFFIFQGEEKKQLKEREEILSEVQEKIFKAENFLILKNEEKANILFKETWQKILPLTKEEGLLRDKAISLKESIEINLKNLSKLEVISEPKLLFEFEPKEFIPQKMVYFNGNLYFFSPLSEKLFKINPQTKSQNFYSFPLGKGSEVSLATIFDNSILFFSKPDKIISLKEDEFGESFSLKPPYPDFNFVGFSSYQRNIYFLDKKRGEIIKYLSPLEKGKDSPQFWLNPQTKKATDGKSMAINGLIWILNENNAISQYHNGQYQNDLIFDIFPSSKRFYKIFTLPHLLYLYLLEPVQSRIIVLKKNGEVFKQFQSEKFENLKDFAVSADGKIIYLLESQKVYQLNI